MVEMDAHQIYSFKSPWGTFSLSREERIAMFSTAAGRLLDDLPKDERNRIYRENYERMAKQKLGLTQH